MTQRGSGWEIAVPRDSGEEWETNHPTLRGVDIPTSMEARNALLLRWVREAFPGAHVEPTTRGTSARIVARPYDRSIDTDVVWEEIERLIQEVDASAAAWMVPLLGG